MAIPSTSYASSWLVDQRSAIIAKAAKQFGAERHAV
jgi:hypothetical protein